MEQGSQLRGRLGHDERAADTIRMGSGQILRRRLQYKYCRRCKSGWQRQMESGHYRLHVQIPRKGSTRCLFGQFARRLQAIVRKIQPRRVSQHLWLERENAMLYVAIYIYRLSYDPCGAVVYHEADNHKICEAVGSKPIRLCEKWLKKSKGWTVSYLFPRTVRYGCN